MLLQCWTYDVCAQLTAAGQVSKFGSKFQDTTVESAEGSIPFYQGSGYPYNGAVRPFKSNVRPIKCKLGALWTHFVVHRG